MTPTDFILPTAIIGFFGYRFFKFSQMKKKLPALLKEGAVIVDVRSPSEFNSGANPISINIPLDRLNEECKKLDKSKTIILCCASGTRSGMALGILKKNGFKNVINGGPWTNTIV